MTFRTEERDDLHRMVEKYKCSPFTGQCYTEEITFHRDRKTGLYHLIFPQSVIDKFKIKEDFVVETGFHQSMIMIQPTDEDNDYLIFKKK